MLFRSADVSRAGSRRAFSARLGIAQVLPMSGLVSRRKARDMGALEPAVRSRGRRLVCAQYVHSRDAPIRVSCKDLWAPITVRVQGHLPSMEGRKMGSQIGRAHV